MLVRLFLNRVFNLSTTKGLTPDWDGSPDISAISRGGNLLGYSGQDMEMEERDRGPTRERGSASKGCTGCPPGDEGTLSIIVSFLRQGVCGLGNAPRGLAS